MSEDTCNIKEIKEREDTTFTLTTTDERFTTRSRTQRDQPVSCTLDRRDFTADALSGNLTKEETLTLTTLWPK